MICNLTEASLHLGYRARSTLQRLVRDGQLEAYRVPSSGREILLDTSPMGRPSLRETVQALTQYRPESPLWQRERERPSPAAEPLVEMSDAELGAYTDRVMAGLDSAPAPDWEAIAARMNEFLGPDWPAPPWDAAQVNTVAMALGLAEEAAAGD
jgi:hypothetical protein